MKIQIDLNDILYDENFGSETLRESVIRQISETVRNELKRETLSKINEETNKIIQEVITENVKKIASEMLPNLLDKEFQPINSWGGHEGKPTTLRNKFIESLQKQFVYTPKQYDSDKNEFTRSIDNQVKLMVGEFKQLYDKKVDELFTQEALYYATDKMKKRLGIT
jgi:hypothetical protein